MSWSAAVRRWRIVTNVVVMTSRTRRDSRIAAYELPAATIFGPVAGPRRQGKRNSKGQVWVARIGLIVVTSGLLAGCGAGAQRTDPVTTKQAVAARTVSAPRRHGTLTVFSAGGVKSVDPGVAKTALDYQAMYATQRPLFSYKPGAFSESSPDLASAPAEIAANARSMTVRLRHGIRFSPPVNGEVTAADVAYAIERGANPHVANPYFKKYFSSVLGAGHAAGGPIAGITTPDKYTIHFRLTSPSAQLVRDALALPLSAPVPPAYARKHDAKSPSDYGDYAVATGPYMVQANRRGKALGYGYRPTRQLTLVPNPNWRAQTDFRPAYVDRVHFEFGAARRQIARRVLEGSNSVQSGPLDRSVQRLAAKRFPAQLHISPSVGVRYIALNNKHGPFSNVDVRKALWAALDRTALSLAAGGPPIARVATHFLYPGFPGSKHAAILIGARRLPYNEHPDGDMAIAKKYLRHAGYRTGKYTGPRIVTVVAVAANPQRKEAEIVDKTLKRLGFKTKLTLVSASAMGPKYCGVPARKIDVCPSLELTADSGDGQLLLAHTFNGGDIAPIDNPNVSQADSPDINNAIERESRVVGTEAVEVSWGSVDNGIVGEGLAIPYQWLSEPEIESKDVAGVSDVWNRGAWDLSFTSLK
jgi:peptide/nickel transport system substrate-binding protein